MPQVAKNKLRFRNREHLKVFYNQIVTQYNEALENDDNQSIDTLLNRIETELNFFSRRAAIKEMTALGLKSSEDEWLPDEIRLSLLNEFYEIEIGDSTYVYSSWNQVYRIPNEQIEVINAFRSAPKGNDSIFHLDLMSQETELISRIATAKKLPRSTGENGTNCFEYVEYLDQPAWCQPNERHFTFRPKVTYMDEFGYTWNGALRLNYMDIDFGDGSPIVETDEALFHEVQHVYSNPGEYQVTFVCYMQTPCAPIGQTAYVTWTESQTVVVPDAPCLNSNEYEKEFVFHSTGQYKMKAELWNSHDIFGEHQVAKTTSEKWDDPWWGQPQWRDHQANVLVDLYWWYRDEDCATLSSAWGVPETDVCNHCKSKRAGKTLTGGQGLYTIGDQEVHSYHRVIVAGQSLEIELELRACE